MNLPTDFFNDMRNDKLRKEVMQLLKDSPIDFFAIIKEAQRLTIADARRKTSHYKQRNFMAENMYGNTIGLLYDNYASYMDVDSEKRPFVKLNNLIWVYIKKLKPKKLTPQNVVTEHDKKIRLQQLFDNEEHVNTIFAGFALSNKDWFVPFKTVCISHLNKFYYDKCSWQIDLADYAKHQTLITPLIEEESNESLVNVKKPDSDNSQTAAQ